MTHLQWQGLIFWRIPQIAVDKKGAKPLLINYRQMGQTTATGPCPVLMVHGKCVWNNCVDGLGV